MYHVEWTNILSKFPGFPDDLKQNSLWVYYSKAPNMHRFLHISRMARLQQITLNLHKYISNV